MTLFEEIRQEIALAVIESTISQRLADKIRHRLDKLEGEDEPRYTAREEKLISLRREEITEFVNLIFGR